MSDIPEDTHEQERRQRLELEQAAAEQLDRVNGAAELQAAVLALLLPAGSRRAKRAWRIEAASAPNHAVLLAHVRHLPSRARLPWFETLVSRMRGQPLAVRQALLAATRRVMGARGVVRPIDRLHWLAMRERLGETSAAGTQTAHSADLSRLPQAEVSAIATYTAFLSRMVPVDAASENTRASDDPPDLDLDLDLDADTSAATAAPGIAWYEGVMQPWRAHATVPPCRPPDTDGLVHALQELQALPWMQRPMLVRGWVAAAQAHSEHGRIGDSAADALRLSCSLLDSPLPPELAQHFGDDLSRAGR